MNNSNLLANRFREVIFDGTFLRNMDAMIEHAYYHLGQIVLIKKLLH